MAFSTTFPNRPFRLPPACSALFVIFLSPSVRLDFKPPLMSKNLVPASVLASENLPLSESNDGIPPLAFSTTFPNNPFRLPPACSALLVIFLRPSVKLDFRLPLTSKKLVPASVLAAENLVLTESSEGIPPLAFSTTFPNRPFRLPPTCSVLVIFLRPSVKLDFRLPLTSKKLVVASVLAAENLVLSEPSDGTPTLTFSVRAFRPPPRDDSKPPPIADFKAPPPKSDRPFIVDAPGIDFKLSVKFDVNDPLTSKKGEDCSSFADSDFLATIKFSDCGWSGEGAWYVWDFISSTLASVIACVTSVGGFIFSACVAASAILASSFALSSASSDLFLKSSKAASASAASSLDPSPTTVKIQGSFTPFSLNTFLPVVRNSGTAGTNDPVPPPLLLPIFQIEPLSYPTYPPQSPAGMNLSNLVVEYLKSKLKVYPSNILGSAPISIALSIVNLSK